MGLVAIFSNKISAHKEKIVFIIFLITLVYHFYLSTRVFSSSINDLHGFRQSQTAISSFFMVKEGLSLAYPLPIFGEPWSAPIEFPLYQWIVTIVSQNHYFTLVQWGRFISLVFFYGSMIAGFYLFLAIGYSKTFTLILLSLCLTMPTYTFWARSFMMETTALFFSVLSAYLFVKAYLRPKVFLILLFIIASSLAAVLKITTLYVWCFFAMSYLLVVMHNTNSARFRLGFALLLLSPLISFYIWNIFTDSVKAQNPFTIYLNSAHHWNDWINIPLQKHFSMQYWHRILIYSMINQKWIIPALLYILIFKFNKKYIPAISGVLIGPLTFTMLYYHHEYYFTAIGILIAFLYCLILQDLFSSEFSISKIIAIISLLFLYYSQDYKYKYYYKSTLNTTQKDDHYEIGERIKNHTKPQDIILYLGADWAPVIPFYSERKAIMLKKKWMNEVGIDSVSRLLHNHKVDYVASAYSPIDSMIYANDLKLKIDSIPVWKKETWPTYFLYKIKRVGQ